MQRWNYVHAKKEVSMKYDEYDDYGAIVRLQAEVKRLRSRAVEARTEAEIARRLGEVYGELYWLRRAEAASDEADTLEEIFKGC